MPVDNKFIYSDITDQIIGIGIKVHSNLGPGFVEKVYQRAMHIELGRSELDVEREKKLNIIYDNKFIGYEVVDFIINNIILLELKSAQEIRDIHKAQLLSYLKTSKCKIGLLLNFGTPKLEIKRIIN